MPLESVLEFPDTYQVDLAAPARPGAAALPSVFDFRRDALDPLMYARLGPAWSIAVVDVVGSTALASQGQDREVNFVAGAAVAALTAALSTGSPDAAPACQFTGDGALAAVPPGQAGAVRQVLAALVHWADDAFGVRLRAGLVPVAALRERGGQVLAALHDFGGGNVSGLFLGDGVEQADAWVKAGARWQVAALEAAVPGALGSPLGDGGRLRPRAAPGSRALRLEAAAVPGARPLAGAARVAGALLGAMWLRIAHALGGRLGPVDERAYRHAMAARSDYRKLAGGVRLVLDVTEDEAGRIEALLQAEEAAGRIRFGTARSPEVTITCMVGDFMAGRHVHFVDGSGLGFWRAAQALKAGLRPGEPDPRPRTRTSSSETAVAETP